jgi:SPASM domain peptide maturase of grasp-with-spasm system
MLDSSPVSLHEDIKEYLQIMLENEIIFYTDSPQFFPEMSTQWDEPFEISNAIIDIDSSSVFATEAIRQLLVSGCRALQIRVYSTMTIKSISSLISLTSKSKINSIELILPFMEENSFQDFELFVKEYPQISLITVYGANKDEAINMTGDKFGIIFYVKEKVYSEKCCGKINPSFFTINTRTFMESQNFNSCLNRKVSVDKVGEIKNCPSMQNSYGNVMNTLIRDVVKNTKFSDVWSKSKSTISECKVCEFRHICTDCRAYVEDPNDDSSKPLKCGYNPLTGEWSEWSENPLKKKAMEYYNI